MTRYKYIIRKRPRLVDWMAKGKARLILVFTISIDHADLSGWVKDHNPRRQHGRQQAG